MKQAINSPFRYAGGKFYARHLILEHIPFHTSYIEPFAGGASIFFAKPKVRHNWLNDIDSDVVNTYLTIRDDANNLINALKDEEALKERHTWYKNEFKPKNDLERATRWYYLNRTSYSGIMNHKNCYWGYGDKYSMRPENWGKNIARASEKLQGVKITSVDFEIVIDNAEDGSFLFVDPPYFNADQDKFYACFFAPEDHLRLASCLRRNQHRLNFLLTYDNCEDIRAMYSWAAEIHDKEWNYTISRTDDQKLTQAIKNGSAGASLPTKNSRSKGKEIFILNYNTEHEPNTNDLFSFTNETEKNAL